MANITFVDENDQVIGHGSKAEALTGNIIHRIARVFVLNNNGKLLIQKRSPSVAIPNRWDQSASGHVDEGEDYDTAAARELNEELGIAGSKIKYITKHYAEETDDNITKRRFSALYRTSYDGDVITNDEVSEIKWIDLAELEQWMQDRPDDFTQGFLQSYQQFKKLS